MPLAIGLGRTIRATVGTLRLADDDQRTQSASSTGQGAFQMFEVSKSQVPRYTTKPSTTRGQSQQLFLAGWRSPTSLIISFFVEAFEVLRVPSQGEDVMGFPHLNHQAALRPLQVNQR
jgi:hypothetical protein